MEHWPLARRPYGSERVLEEEVLRTAQLEVRNKQCLPKAQYIPMFLVHGFSNTPILHYSSTPILPQKGSYIQG